MELCITCKHHIKIEVAFDDIRYFCVNPNTKTVPFDVPIGYLCSNGETPACSLHSLATVEEEEQETEPAYA